MTTIRWVTSFVSLMKQSDELGSTANVHGLHSDCAYLSAKNLSRLIVFLTTFVPRPVAKTWAVTWSEVAARYVLSG